MDKIKLFTIDFTKKSAEEFFCRLKRVGVRRVIDIRLNNVSQLAGFAKRDDLRYFLKALDRVTHNPQPMQRSRFTQYLSSSTKTASIGQRLTHRPYFLQKEASLAEYNQRLYPAGV